ncbi:hypothetical protein PHYSODRAFT_332829 [Phytophthora sojae]|uniref:Uncharacterized protein n=1 Tax=Phytophthora sojae (strain P6497) TaxID=1094619 RepID=G4ZQ53_PHYSP|nr:hypothetical protein PHYSODRAFT_332829 [Phytophthora sojae]EGZ14442.1 hypothetical protein PHYSODRAFT_332829 [Phytophthora sojae]|eukprot:XP_009528191.1 hypothetical protein PHYSODRAFT_332829 [Phytophthora sojae]
MPACLPFKLHAGMDFTVTQDEQLEQKHTIESSKGMELKQEPKQEQEMKRLEKE